MHFLTSKPDHREMLIIADAQEHGGKSTDCQSQTTRGKSSLQGKSIFSEFNTFYQ